MPLCVSYTLSDGTLVHMKEVRCERCDNIIGLGCACPPDGSVPKAHPEERRVRQEWRRFPGNAILIKQNGKAHVPGACDHMTEDEVRPPKWGWILDPSPGDWGRISEGSPAIATGGNAQLRATSRCMTCMGTLGG
jgi:hypothetical protein